LKKQSSFGGKFVNTMFLVGGIVAACTLAVVLALSARTSAAHLAIVQRQIEEGIVSKGQALAKNHALALRGLTLQSGFGDIRSLVEQTVKEDPDVVYGLYVDAGGEAIAFALRGNELGQTPPAHGLGGFASERSAWRRLAIPPRELLALEPETKRAMRLGLDLLEVAVPVRGEEGEVIGSLRYGLSTSRIDVAVARAKSEAALSLTHSVVLLGLAIAAATSLGLWLSLRQRGSVRPSLPTSS